MIQFASVIKEEPCLYIQDGKGNKITIEGSDVKRLHEHLKEVMKEYIK